MLVDVIYAGVKICALASVCAYGWLKVRQERKTEISKQEAEKTACKNCCYCRMISANGNVVCGFEEKSIKQPAYCPLFTKWPKGYKPRLCIYCEHCRECNLDGVFCGVLERWCHKPDISCGNYKKRHEYFPNTRANADSQGAFIQVPDGFSESITMWKYEH